ncbi:Vacuolar protein sorting-associated protein 9A [Acorus gramineus]|uniref:Vacuolar protein sorting-associated protein 9A n=1 Tax=Acorus gramineus TaxID=55184 RepID=A0AAV9AGD1_ACOGR|nr:Vacuolar protein sorting-associated protein 9A [Acorus gramineus]
MENADPFVASTAPLTWHDFLERMRHPSAADFVKSIKSFIVSFSNRVPDPKRDSTSVQEFLSSMEGAFRAHSLFTGCTEEELESAGEGLEKYVMTKLFNRAFASLPEEVKRDEELSEKMSLLQQFIRPESLDIKPTFQNETSWLLAQKELQKINMYKAPRDKIICILNCCKVINNLLLNASVASNDNPPGADEFLPVLIYVTIKANPPQLHSNLFYIQRYRGQSRLVSEAAYFFTNLLSAESFIWNIDAKSLSMDEEEFKNNMDSARALLSGLERHTGQGDQDRSHPSNEESKSINKGEKDHSLTKTTSIPDLEKKGATDLLKEDELNRYFQEYPFLYANYGDLTVDDVESLLNSYKQLVLKYVCLSKGMGNSSPSVSESSAKTEPQTDNNEKILDGTNDDKGENITIEESASFSSLIGMDNIDASVRHQRPESDETSN